VYEPLDPPVTPGQHYFTLDELRAERPDTADADDETLERQQTLAEELMEAATGIGFIPRTRIETVTSSTSGLLRLARPYVRRIAGVEEAGTAWTPERVGELWFENSYIVGVPGWGTTVTVTYEHGMDAPPERVRRAVMTATRIWALRGPVDERATQIGTDAGGTINLATPGLAGFITGIPEFDATIAFYRRPGRLA
jgi:hypothetical protein